MASAFERVHGEQLLGTLTTVDRLIVHGHLSRLWFPNHMAYFLDRLGVHIARDFGQFVKDASSKVIAHAEAVARKAGRPLPTRTGWCTERTTWLARSQFETALRRV